MAPFVGANVKGKLGNGAFKGLGKDGIGDERVLVSSRVELVFAGISKPVVNLRFMCKEMS